MCRSTNSDISPGGVRNECRKLCHFMPTEISAAKSQGDEKKEAEESC